MAKLTLSNSNRSDNFVPAEAFFNIELVGTKMEGKKKVEVVKKIGGIPLHLKTAIHAFLIENGEKLEDMKFRHTIRSAEPAALDEDVSFF